MKVQALGNLSGAVGERSKGEVFTVEASIAKSLIDRGLVVKADELPVHSQKPEQAKE